MLEEMDEEFGIGGLIEKEFQPIKKKVCISAETLKPLGF